MAAGLALRVAVGTTGASLHQSIIDQSATGASIFGSPRSFVVPPGESLASVRIKAPTRRDIVQSWRGKNLFVPLTVAIDDSVIAAGPAPSDRSIREDIGDPKEDLDSRGVQERQLSESPSRFPSSADSKPRLQGEGGTPTLDESQRWTLVKKNLAGIISNAQKKSQGVYHIRHSLGVDLGDSRTGVAISLKGYAPRPLSVLQLKGDKLIENLLQIASKERADEFIVGLPTSFDGKETPQSNKTRSFAGRLAAQAAQRGWRVYLLDEYGSSQDGMDYMLGIGIKKKSRKEKLDSYAALVLLHSYFRSEGVHVKLVIPKGLSIQERLCLGDESVIDEFNTEDDV